MSYLEDKRNVSCYGCGACQNSCPVDCISMVADNEGFLYPDIVEEECISCGKCEEVCPYYNEKKHGFQRPSVYAGWNLDENIRDSHLSEGVFIAIAETVLNAGGVVFGAVFNERFHVTHHLINNRNDLKLLCGSKYAQSFIGNMYNMAKKCLDENINVLFSGTPCQIAGLYSFLGEKYDNLLTCELICHGVYSPKLWGKYMDYIQYKCQERPQWMRFRNIKNERKNHSFSTQAHNLLWSKDQFMIEFLQNYLRPSCYECSFAALPRGSDMTFADFSDIAKKNLCVDENKEISLVFVNTEKGRELFNQCKDRLFYLACDLDLSGSKDLNIFNPAISYSSNRQAFFEDLNKEKFSFLMNKYMMQPTICHRIFNKLKQYGKYFA